MNYATSLRDAKKFSSNKALALRTKREEGRGAGGGEIIDWLMISDFTRRYGRNKRRKREGEGKHLKKMINAFNYKV